MTGATQFEGRTAEEAMARARAALGTSSDLRCWKTRRGGVAGFFATEVFVASIDPPPGSETQTSPRVLRRGSKGRGSSPTTAAGPSPDGGAEFGTDQAARWPDELDGQFEQQPDAVAGSTDLLSGLVEATADEVSLRSVSIPPEAFHDVLAQAQAALARHAESGGTTDLPVPPGPTAALPPPPDVACPKVDLPPPPDVGRTGTPSGTGKPSAAARKVERSTPPKPRAKPKAGGRTATTPRPPRAEPAHSQGSEHLPDLRSGLLALGLDDDYLPRGQRPSLDALARALARVPVPPPLPSGTGSVVAVVGSRPYLDRTIDLVATELSLDRRAVLWPDDDARLDRLVARRRASGRASLVAMEGGPGLLSGPPAAQLQRVAPDYVLAAVGAQGKRDDVVHWVGRLATVDALALWDLDATCTPAELLGMVPLAFVDGEPSSALAWTLILARRATARRR
jgi:hypothetical protein